LQMGRAAMAALAARPREQAAPLGNLEKRLSG